MNNWDLVTAPSVPARRPRRSRPAQAARSAVASELSGTADRRARYFPLIRQRQRRETLRVCEAPLRDTHYLIHKAQAACCARSASATSVRLARSLTATQSDAAHDAPLLARAPPDHGRNSTWRPLGGERGGFESCGRARRASSRGPGAPDSPMCPTPTRRSSSARSTIRPAMKCLQRSAKQGPFKGSELLLGGRPRRPQRRPLSRDARGVHPRPRSPSFPRRRRDGRRPGAPGRAPARPRCRAGGTSTGRGDAPRPPCGPPPRRPGRAAQRLAAVRGRRRPWREGAAARRRSVVPRLGRGRRPGELGGRGRERAHAPRLRSGLVSRGPLEEVRAATRASSSAPPGPRRSASAPRRPALGEGREDPDLLGSAGRRPARAAPPPIQLQLVIAGAA